LNSLQSGDVDQANENVPNDESSDDDVLNDDEMNEKQSESHPNVADNADTSLQAEDDDFGNLFDEIETHLLSDGKY